MPTLKYSRLGPGIIENYRMKPKMVGMEEAPTSLLSQLTCEEYINDLFSEFEWKLEKERVMMENQGSKAYDERVKNVKKVLSAGIDINQMKNMNGAQEFHDYFKQYSKEQ